MTRHFLSSTINAATVLGTQLSAARRTQQRTTTEIAERAAITRVTLRRIERGDPSVSIGLYFEVAGILNVPLFGSSGKELAELAALGKRELALLPARIITSLNEVFDAF